MSRIHGHILYVAINRIKLRALFMHNMRNVPEELVQLPNASLNVADLGLPLYNQRLLEIYLIL